jgi:hypothetical protein
VVGGSKCNKNTLDEETVSFIHSLSFSFTLIDIFRDEGKRRKNEDKGRKMRYGNERERR